MPTVEKGRSPKPGLGVAALLLVFAACSHGAGAERSSPPDGVLPVFRERFFTRELAEVHGLPDDLIAKARAVAEAAPSRDGKPGADDEPIARIWALFTAEQGQQLRRLCWLELGGDALLTRTVRTELRISDEQARGLAAIRNEHDKRWQEHLDSLPRVSADAFRKMQRAAASVKLQAMLAALLPAQQAAWLKLVQS